VKHLGAQDGGATAIEYALIASLVSIVIVTALTSMGQSLSGFFTSVATNLR
jgi:pilus assembly protein Flp/PilA